MNTTPMLIAIRTRPLCPLLLLVLTLGLAAPLGAARIDGVACNEAGALTLSFVGDIMAHTPNVRMADYDRIYAAVRSYFQNDDLTFANLEAPIDDAMAYRTYPRFNVQRPYVAAAIRNGVEVFSLANNHINDWGVASLTGTIAAFTALARGGGIYTNGIRRAAAEFTVQTIVLRGQRIGFLALTQFVNNADETARQVQIVDYRSAAAVQRLLAYIRSHSDDYDLFIVSYHGGAEYQVSASAAKRQFFYTLAAAGADIIWGHHPHVLQPWELYRTTTGHQAVIMHSLGNFVSGQTWFVPPDNPQHERAPTGDSIILQVCARRGGPEPLRVQAVPISHYKTADGGVEVRLYRQLVRGTNIAPEWQPYYRSRYALLRQQYDDLGTVE